MPFSSQMEKKNHDHYRNEFCTSLLDQMTLEEKVGQMVQADLTWKQDIKQLVKEGRIGSLLTVHEPEVISEYQHIAVDQSRLKIPLLVGNDIIHGYRSIFPIPLALACTWDTDLIEWIARTSMIEAVAAGTSWTFAPMVDISRDSRWGRVAEGAGEDPLLSSRIGQAWVRGFQSYRDEKGRSVAACVKHFAAYGGVESGKDYNSVDMSERRLREEYLPPYHAAIQAGVQTIMTAFNDLNGLPATANPFLLRKILRDEWDFKGVIISDFDSIGELVLHGFAHDHKEAALRSVLAGVDIDMMGDAYHFHLADLVREDKVSESLLDESVFRILKLKFDLGFFEDPFIDESKSESKFLHPSTMELAAQSAAQSIVLLKNKDSLLPLDPADKTIALIGPLSDERRSLLGCWSFDGKAEDTESLHQALDRNLPPGSQLVTAQGCSINGNETDFSDAINAAARSDIVLLALGESDVMSGEAHSRSKLGLPGRQKKLLEAIAATGKPVVLLLFCGRPLVLTDVIDRVSAVLLPWQGGTRAAQGVCDVLLGKVNPSAKLAISFPRSVGQIPVYYAHKSTGRPFESHGTLQFNQLHKSLYLDESNDPLFPFGFGLSYTNFNYSDLVISNPKLARAETLKISATITNTGQYSGSEIVQLYVRDLVGMVTRPVKELKDFKKINLDPGKSCRVEFDLPAKVLTFLDPDLKPILEPGNFKVWIAPNSAEGLEGDFELI